MAGTFLYLVLFLVFSSMTAISKVKIINAKYDICMYHSFQCDITRYEQWKQI